MPLLEMRNIVKEFPGVKALDGVSFTLQRGEFHSLVGENGAGKSTLMKVLSGVYPSGTFTGEILVDGEAQNFRAVRDSNSAGIAVIYQELSLVKELTVAENIFLGREPSRLGVINSAQLYDRAAKLLADVHLHIDARIKVGALGLGQQQLVEIAKALSQEANILVLDEPTAALTASVVKSLFDILKRLRDRDVGMIYISHKLEEVFKMSDRITVLRDGKTVLTEVASQTNKNTVVAAMVGRELSEVFPERKHRIGESALRIKNLTAYSFDDPEKKILRNISFDVKKGEVVGIAGLMGARRTELLMTMFGAWQGKYSFEIEIDGKPVEIRSPADAIGNGIGFVTEDRQRFGLILDQTIRNNMTLAGLSDSLVTNRALETVSTKRMIQSLRIRASSPMTVVGTLSGGNQQKVVLGKWLLTGPKILLLDEPTRGIDVGAKQEVYAEINKLAHDGMAIVLVSSELPEVLGLSDRVIVLHEGRMTGEFSRDEATPEKVMSAAMEQGTFRTN
jgi:D-xylose transport system ATP-binding protein